MAETSGSKSVPESIRFLAEYLATVKIRDSFCGLEPDMEAATDTDLVWEQTLGGWVPAGVDPSQFVVLGGEASSTYALWHHSELGERAPPVVFISSEFTMRVIATDARSFLELVATGACDSALELAFLTDDELSEFSPDPVDSPSALDRYRAEIQERFGIVPREASAILAQAASEHPNLQDFFDDLHAKVFPGSPSG